MAAPLITALHERSVYAYEREDDQAPPGLRTVGAVLALAAAGLRTGPHQR